MDTGSRNGEWESAWLEGVAYEKTGMHELAWDFSIARARRFKSAKIVRSQIMMGHSFLR